MASSNNLGALSQDGDLPFGHPGPNFDDTPEGFEPSPLVDQGPERDCMPDEDHDAIVPLRPGRTSTLRDREHDRGLHGRPGPGGRMPRLPGTGCREPGRGQRALGELPPLPAGDLRPERRRVAARRLPALPALREARMVRRSEIAVEKIAKLRRPPQTVTVYVRADNDSVIED